MRGTEPGDQSLELKGSFAIGANGEIKFSEEIRTHHLAKTH